VRPLYNDVPASTALVWIARNTTFGRLVECYSYLFGLPSVLMNENGPMIEVNQFRQKTGTSQGGEDGMLEAIFRELGIEKGVFVEFGAWDGKRYSNTWRLAANGWSGLYIEGDSARASECIKNTREFPEVHTHVGFVSLEDGERIDQLLAKYPSIRRDFDLLSIDIDSYDYWVWGDLTYEPNVVVIEYNPNWKDARTISYDRRYRFEETQYFGASCSAIASLGQHKRYDLVGWTPGLNMVFVKTELNRGRFRVVSTEEIATFDDVRPPAQFHTSTPAVFDIDPAMTWDEELTRSDRTILRITTERGLRFKLGLLFYRSRRRARRLLRLFKHACLKAKRIIGIR